jgi:hypothetical protein
MAVGKASGVASGLAATDSSRRPGLCRRERRRRAFAEPFLSSFVFQAKSVGEAVREAVRGAPRFKQVIVWVWPMCRS